MAMFKDFNTEMEFRRFVQYDLADKYHLPIEVREEQIVTGLTGSDKIQDAVKIGLFPKYAKTEWVEDRIAEDINRYCYEHELNFIKSPVVERCVWNGEIKYEIVYTNGDD